MLVGWLKLIIWLNSFIITLICVWGCYSIGSSVIKDWFSLIAKIAVWYWWSAIKIGANIASSWTNMNRGLSRIVCPYWATLYRLESWWNISIIVVFVLDDVIFGFYLLLCLLLRLSCWFTHFQFRKALSNFVFFERLCKTINAIAYVHIFAFTNLYFFLWWLYLDRLHFWVFKSYTPYVLIYFWFFNQLLSFIFIFSDLPHLITPLLFS